MTIHQLSFKSADELAGALAALGADPRSLPFFDNKREVRCLCVRNADVRAANVMKQEMLSLGGDAAVHAHAVDCRAERSGVMLFGTKKQLANFADKIELMPWWNFPKTAQDIRATLAGTSVGTRRVTLPCGAELTFGSRTHIMGIINLTDDSFYAKSRTCGCAETAAARAVEMVRSGADIIDIGAESTRPGAARVPEEQEVSRISIATEAIRRELPQIPISADTTRESTARAALEAGADIINDISGLTYEPRVAAAAAEHGAMLILMHMRGTPETMASLCEYGDLLGDITDFFDDGISKAREMGVDRAKIILDPGIGFAKNHAQNLFILKHTESFRTFGLPLLIGASRKGTVGAATESPDAADRLEGTLAISALCAWQGVDIVRVHDVRENKKAIMMASAIAGAKYE